MTIWLKEDGEWTTVQRPYIKRTGVHRPARAIYVKRSGVWEQAFEHDTTPSLVPLISLQVIDNRFIKVGIRTPGATNDSDLRRIRVLASRKGPLGTQFGSGFIANDDTNYPREPWSDWYYNSSNPNGGGGRADSSVESYKEYPVNASKDTNLPGGTFYYFAAWSEDQNGNWSAANQAKIWMPKKNPDRTRGRIVREARFQTREAGSRNTNGVTFTDGELVVRETPASNGFFYYGNQIGQAVGERGTPTILSAQIRIRRGNDAGQPTANVWLFWHTAQVSTTATTDANRNGITKVGTINKGESKWFDVPSSYFSQFNTQLKGFGLAWGNQASDYLVAPDRGIDMRNGEVNVVWEEEL